MYDENQLVEMTWSNATKEYYKSKGYQFTNMYDNFFVKAKELSPSSHAKIEVVCDYCGTKFEKCFSLLTRGRKEINKDACSNCKIKKRNEINRIDRMNNSYGMAKLICNENGYVFIEPNFEYKNQHMYIEFICKKHGKQKMSLYSFLQKKVCAKCSIEQNKTNKLDISYITKTISNDGNTLLNPEDYKRTTTHNLRIKCQCGNEYVTSFDCYVHIGVNRCPICTKRISKNEIYIADVLDKFNVNYEREKRFYYCRDKLPEERLK